MHTGGNVLCWVMTVRDTSFKKTETLREYRTYGVDPLCTYVMLPPTFLRFHKKAPRTVLLKFSRNGLGKGQKGQKLCIK